MWVQISLTLVFYVWLFLVLFFLYRLSRETSRHIQQLQNVLIDIAHQNAASANVAAEAARLLAETLNQQKATPLT